MVRVGNSAVTDSEAAAPASQRTGKPRRRTQAERSELMRARLSEAAFNVIAERGHTALRMAAVAEAAGASQGALLHHFPDKDAVILAAIRYAFTLAARQSRQSLVRCPTEPEGALRLLFADLNTFFFGDCFWVSLGITLDASKNPALAPMIRRIAAEYRRPVYDAWQAALAAAGWPAPEAAMIVREAAALVSGSAIRKLWSEPDACAQAIEQRWIRYKLADLAQAGAGSAVAPA